MLLEAVLFRDVNDLCWREGSSDWGVISTREMFYSDIVWLSLGVVEQYNRQHLYLESAHEPAISKSQFQKVDHSRSTYLYPIDFFDP